MVRYDYLNKELATSTGVDLYNLTKINWRKFNPLNPIRYHYVSSDELDRPYLISYKEYSSVDYEDLILMVNKIIDPFSLFIGQKLQIPKLQDILDFINTELT